MQSLPGGSQRVAKGTAPARRFSLAGLRRRQSALAEREVDGVVYKYGPCSTLAGARARGGRVIARFLPEDGGELKEQEEAL